MQRQSANVEVVVAQGEYSYSASRMLQRLHGSNDRKEVLCNGVSLMTVKYHASACFDIDTEVEVDDDADSFEVWLSIIGDLESRYGLKISVQS